jgi:site-specific recombinase XerC
MTSGGVPEPQWQVEPFLEHLEWERNLSPATLRAYRREVVSAIGFMAADNGADGPADVTLAAIRGWLAELHGRGLAGRSVERALAALRTYFGFLVGEGVLTSNPAALVPRVRTRRTVPEVVDRHGLDELFEAFPDSPAGRRDRAAVELLYGAGLRVSELVGLDLVDLQLGRRLLRVRGKGRKERIVPFGRQAETALSLYLPERAQWRLQTPCSSISGEVA